MSTNLIFHRSYFTLLPFPQLVRVGTNERTARYEFFSYTSYIVETKTAKERKRERERERESKESKDRRRSTPQQTQKKKKQKPKAKLIWKKAKYFSPFFFLSFYTDASPKNKEKNKG